MAFSNHIVIAAVKKLVPVSMEKSGETLLVKTLKIVNANDAFTRFSMNKPKEPDKGK
tara:strand:- start:34 stop:204 length:171 start_codon:yes stop_codon:yes gene_type:complete